MVYGLVASPLFPISGGHSKCAAVPGRARVSDTWIFVSRNSRLESTKEREDSDQWTRIGWADRLASDLDDKRAL